MGLRQKALDATTRLLKIGIQVFGGSSAASISARLSEDMAPTMTQKTDFGTIAFFCPGKLPEYRARTLLTKEPETIEWINTFNDTDVLWDIGANVGVYSLYAALRGLNVVSFEPSPSNYYLLSRNIEANRMDEKIIALCIAFNDTTKLDAFYMANTELGGALNSFGEAIDWQGQPFIASFKQAMIGFSIDDFIEQFDLPFPNHIKIDVDGIENKIIKGAEKTLASEKLRSILVELDSNRDEYCSSVIDMLERAGMRFHKKMHAPQHADCSSYNYFFFRSNE